MVLPLEATIKRQLKEHRNAHFIMIDGISKLMTGEVDTCRSTDFHASGLKWRLYIGGKDGQHVYLPFRISIVDTMDFGVSWSVKCRVKLTMVSLTGHHHLCISFVASFKGNGERTGFNNSISYELLKEKCLVNDKAVFCIEISDVEASFRITHHIPRVMATAECIKPFVVHQSNSKFTWKITDFSSFNGKHHSSDEFTFGPRKWKLLMYPHGSLHGDGYLSLYLSATGYVTSGPKIPTFAEFKLRALDQGPHHNNHETRHDALFFGGKQAQSVGKTKFLSLKELHDPASGFLVNDEICLGVEFLAISGVVNL